MIEIGPRLLCAIKHVAIALVFVAIILIVIKTICNKLK